MLSKMPDEEPEPPSGIKTLSPLSPPSQEQPARPGAFTWLKGLLKSPASNSNSLREALEEYIEEIEETHTSEEEIEGHHALITSVLKTHDMTVYDIMIPRADIVAIDIDSPFDELKTLLTEEQFSRIPVFRGNLDELIGAIHIKDILSTLLAGKTFTIADHIREVEVVSPSMPLMDLLQKMQEDKRHMVLVMDEFGGIDGLVTINDVIESMIGEIEDEFDQDDQPEVIEKLDGSVIVDGRMDIEDFEEIYGAFLSADEREDIDTLGGLASSIAGYVPTKGEVLNHASGVTLEVHEADARRVHRLRVRNLPARQSADEV